MTLGTHIATLRVAQGFSQAELAELLEVSRQSVSKWETDTSVPELDKLLRISQVFGVTLDELVKGDGPVSAELVESVSAPEPVSNPPRQPLRVMVGSILMLFGGLLALIFSLRGTPLSMVLTIALPFLSCGAVCLLAKTHILLWCGWCLLIPYYFYDIGFGLGAVVSLLWPRPIVPPLLLILYTAWTLRDKLWGSPRHRGLFIWGWLYGVVVYLILRRLGLQFYSTIVLWLSRAARLRWQLLGHVLLVLSTLLALVLVSTALAGLFYCSSCFLRKRRSN